MKYIKTLSSIALVISATLLSGCAIHPEAIDSSEHYYEMQKKLAESYEEQVAAPKTLTLTEAISRGLKYNLDYRVHIAMNALAAGELSAAYMKMLPSINASFDRSVRNNEFQQLLVGANGQPQTNNSSVTPRALSTARLGLDWNILDFGLSYFTAQQQANRVMIAHEEKEKVTQNLMNQITLAFVKAYSAQILEKRVELLHKKVSQAIDKADKVIQSKASPEAEQLEYQQSLLNSIRKLNVLLLTINQAKSQLLELLHLPANSDTTLVLKYKSLDFLPKIDVSLKEMDTVTLAFNPNLREASYNAKIAKLGIYTSILKLLPNFSLGYGLNYSNNSFLVNQRWLGFDLNASWDLLQTLTTGVQSVHLSNVNHDIEKFKTVALAATVLTQLRTAYMNYLFKRNDYLYAVKENQINQDLAKEARVLYAANRISKQKLIFRELNAIDAELDLYTSFGKAHEAYTELYASLGIRKLPYNLDEMPLDKIQDYTLKWFKDSGGYNFNSLVSSFHKKAQQYLAMKRVQANGNEKEKKNDNENENGKVKNK